MTAPEPTAGAPAAPSKRSPGVVAAIVIVVVIVLVGGAFLVYKLTKSKDAVEPAAIVAKRAAAAVVSGDHATLRNLSTGTGITQLLALKPGDVSGFKINFASCKPLSGSTPARVCTATRPGAQLSMSLVLVNGKWKVSKALAVPVGLPPTSTSTTT